MSSALSGMDLHMQASVTYRTWRGGLAAVVACACAGCGHSPLAPLADNPAPPAYREAPGAAALPQTADWRAFDDPRLEAWLARALSGSPTLAQAAARVERAAALLGGQAALAAPHVDASVAASRRDGALVNDAGSRGNLFQAGLSLRWDPDLFHQLSRQQQVARQDLLAQRALYHQAWLALQADVTQAYLAARMAHRERAVLDELLRTDEALVGAAWRRVAAGLAPPSEHEAALIAQQQDALARQALLRREAQLDHALVALAGGDATLAAAEPLRSTTALAPAQPREVESAPLPALPVVPPGLPSQMLQQRPDVAAAQARVQAARLRLGLAQDAWFPSLALTAQAGQASSELGQWLHAAARSSALGLLLSLPVLDGGRRDAERDAALAQLNEATSTYRALVVTALREVDDQLVARRTWDEASRLQAGRVELALQAQARAHRQWRQGLLPGTDAWQALRAVLLQQQQWIQAEAARGEATVALVHALGGGWQSVVQMARSR